MRVPIGGMFNSSQLRISPARAFLSFAMYEPSAHVHTRVVMEQLIATIVKWTCSAGVLFMAFGCLKAAALCNSLTESRVLHK